MNNVSLFSIPQNLQLNIFVDSSQNEFCAVAYWRYEDVGGQINVRFVEPKTKCVPLKAFSIPRLELQAAVLSVRLRQSILEGHEITPFRVCMFTVINGLTDFTRFSSFSRLKRTMAWVNRFINGSSKIYRQHPDYGITASELDFVESASNNLRHALMKTAF